MGASDSSSLGTNAVANPGTNAVAPTVTIAPGVEAKHRLRVRYGETDQMGVVYHGVYVTYLEIGRTEFMRAIGMPYSSLERRGYFLVIVEVNMKLHAAARYDDELEIATRVDKLRPSSVYFGYTIRNVATQQVLTTGDTRLACLDSATRKVAAIPDDLAALMSACVAPVRPS